MLQQVLVLDLAQLEQRLQGTLDLHKTKAAKLFGVPPEAVTPEQRRYAKTINYAEWYTPRPIPRSSK